MSLQLYYHVPSREPWHHSCEVRNTSNMTPKLSSSNTSLFIQEHVTFAFSPLPQTSTIAFQKTRVVSNSGCKFLQAVSTSAIHLTLSSYPKSTAPWHLRGKAWILHRTRALVWIQSALPLWLSRSSKLTCIASGPCGISNLQQLLVLAQERAPAPASTQVNPAYPLGSSISRRIQASASGFSLP